MKKKGISLIVLVITIVVIIILAAAVILSLGKNNPINSAKEAKVKTTIDNFKSDLVMSVSKITTDSLGQVAITDIDAPSEKYTMADLIPSIKDTEYEEELVVLDGKIQVKEKSSLPIETQLEINNALGQSITASIVKNNPDIYYGKQVKYTPSNGCNVGWQIFHSDGNNIYLISSDYIETKYVSNAGFAEAASYVIRDNSRSSLLEKLRNSSNYDGFKDTLKKAGNVMGTSTLELYCASYNSVSHPSDKIQKIYYDTTDTPMDDGEYGYYVGKKENPTGGYIGGLDKGYNSLYVITTNKKAQTCLLIAGAANCNINDTIYNNMLHIGYIADLSCINTMANYFGIRPVVKLNNNVSLVDNEDGTFNLK